MSVSSSGRERPNRSSRHTTTTSPAAEASISSASAARPAPRRPRRSRSALTSGHKTILAALDLPEPPRYVTFTPGNHAAAE